MATLTYWGYYQILNIGVYMGILDDFEMHGNNVIFIEKTVLRLGSYNVKIM